MKKNFIQICVFMLLFCMIFSCKKNSDDVILPVDDLNTSTPTGTPAGSVVSKLIGVSGGQLSSADGTLQVIIPDGALTGSTNISIQPITNMLPGGIGNAFRILPHGTAFSKPVTIVINYKIADLDSIAPEGLDIAWQNEEGSWQAMTNIERDPVNRRLRIKTNHFSDWGYFKSMNLEPAAASVQPGGELELKVTTRFPYIDPDDVPAGQPVIKVLKEPRDLRDDEISRWSYVGGGILISRGTKAYYTAPSEAPDVNPEVVTAHVNMKRKGQFMLVSNITVLSSEKIAYLHVDEDYKKVANKGMCMLYLYGSFGNDPGTAKRTVTIDGTPVEVNLWSPGIIRCAIDREIHGAIEVVSSNTTVARSVLRRYSGEFVYERFQGGKANAGSTNPLKETTTFRIVYRGFGDVCPPEINPIFRHDATAAFGTRADYKLGGAAAVTTPGSCPVTTSVSLPETSGILLLNTIAGSPDTRLECEVGEEAGGISIEMEFRVVDVITGVKVKRENCNYSSFDTPKPLDVSFEGFGRKPIHLSFTDNGGLILKGSNQLKSGNLSSDILIEAWDGTGNPSHYVTDGMVPATFSNK